MMINTTIHKGRNEDNDVENDKNEFVTEEELEYLSVKVVEEV
jgi:hypothetical protein